MRLAVAALVTLAASCSVPSVAAAATVPKPFAVFPQVTGGSAAGELGFPSAVAADPGDGHVYVGDGANARIAEFTAWGEFVKAWGWGVVASGPNNDPRNEIQQVTVEPAVTSGAFKLLPREQLAATAAISYDASAATVEEALEAHASIGPGNVEVSGEAGGPWTIEYLGELADQDITPLEVVESTLVGGEASVETTQVGGNFEVCEPDLGDVCRAGQWVGTEPGELRSPKGLAIDPVSGDLYVYEGNKQFLNSLRVQRFDPSTGEFLAMIGGEVNKTTSADLCTVADIEGGDECGAGVPGAGEAEFLNQLAGSFGGNITVDGGGNLYVGDRERIQRFDSGGSYVSSLPLPGVGDTKALVYDPLSKALYFAFVQVSSGDLHPNVFKLDPTTGAVIGEIEVEFPLSLSTDPEGNLFVIASTNLGTLGAKEVIEFDALGQPLIPLGEGFDPIEGSTEVAPLSGIAVNTGCETTGVYVANTTSDTIDAFGEAPNPEICEPPPVPPTIVSQFAAAVGEDQATLKAQINPHFWVDTSFYLEYGPEDCKLGGCDRQPLGTEVGLPEAVVGFALTTPGITLTGLEPNTTYHYRFVAESSGGGPVFGIGEAEEGATFKTRKPIPPETDCPNQAYRGGAGANLPDCRAYELVSPIDKEGGSTVGRPGGPAIDQATPEGEKLTFSSYRAFDGAEGANFTTQYLAERGAGGWQANGISPPVGVPFVNIGNIIGNEFRAFSEDLCAGWFVRNSNPSLADAAPESFANLYSRQSCPLGAPGYEALIDGAVEESTTKGFWPNLQGLSADESVAVFRANGKLTENAAPGIELAQVYASTPEGLELVSVLPGGEASPTHSSVGVGLVSNSGKGLTDTVARAVSGDGSRIYWTQGSSEGKLFVRVDGTETRKVSELISEEPARFRTASSDGSLAFFTIKEALYRYDFAENAASLVAGEVPGVLGLSADGSRLYFVSREALALEAVAGTPNLYLEAEGEVKLVAVLASGDAETVRASSLNRDPSKRLGRLSEDGEHLAFISTSKELAEETAGYDNTDAVSGEPDALVYLYDAGTEALRCVSCDPSGARPSGRLFANGFEGGPDLYAAAWIPPWTTQLYPSRALAEDGSHLYFNSQTPLVPTDTNGKADVYQWAEPGYGGCEEASASYLEAAGGCIELISSGKSEVDSEFIDASEDGTDVFFTTERSLLATDPEAIDVYDARIGGGFPGPPAPPPACQGEACQAPGSAPALKSPVTQEVQSKGNVKPKKKKRRCPKGKRKVKRKGKVRCIKKKGAKRAKHRISSHRRVR